MHSCDNCKFYYNLVFRRTFFQEMCIRDRKRYQGYCSLVISREVFFVSEGHRKPETDVYKRQIEDCQEIFEKSVQGNETIERLLYQKGGKVSRGPEDIPFIARCV